MASPFCPPCESVLIVLPNPASSAARHTATMVEEFSHRLLRHQPRRFTDSVTALRRRHFQTVPRKHEVYDLGARILLPREVNAGSVRLKLRASGPSAFDLWRIGSSDAVCGTVPRLAERLNQGSGGPVIGASLLMLRVSAPVALAFIEVRGTGG